MRQYARVAPFHLNAWPAVLPLYREALQAAGRASTTVRLHTHYLGILQRTFPAPWDVTTANLRSVLAHPSWGAEARKSARAVFRSFYRWGHAEGYVEADPALALAPVTVRPKPSNPTPEVVVQELLLDNSERLVFMSLLAGCMAMRVGEIARVHSEDYNRYTEELLVHGKGDRERVLPVTDAQLRLFLRRADGWAFPNRTGGHLSPGYVSKLLSHAQPKGWTGHSLRHRAANKAHDEILDVRAVQEFLGHAQLNTTMGYLRVTRDRLRRAVEASSAINQDRRRMSA